VWRVWFSLGRTTSWEELQAVGRPHDAAGRGVGRAEPGLQSPWEPLYPEKADGQVNYKERPLLSLELMARTGAGRDARIVARETSTRVGRRRASSSRGL